MRTAYGRGCATRYLALLATKTSALIHDTGLRRRWPLACNGIYLNARDLSLSSLAVTPLAGHVAGRFRGCATQAVPPVADAPLLLGLPVVMEQERTLGLRVATARICTFGVRRGSRARKAAATGSVGAGLRVRRGSFRLFERRVVRISRGRSRQTPRLSRLRSGPTGCPPAASRRREAKAEARVARPALATMQKPTHPGRGQLLVVGRMVESEAGEWWGPRRALPGHVRAIGGWRPGSSFPRALRDLGASRRDASPTTKAGLVSRGEPAECGCSTSRGSCRPGGRFARAAADPPEPHDRGVPLTRGSHPVRSTAGLAPADTRSRRAAAHRGARPGRTSQPD